MTLPHDELQDFHKPPPNGIFTHLAIGGHVGLAVCGCVQILEYGQRLTRIFICG